MKSAIRILLVLPMLGVVSLSCDGQCSQGTDGCVQDVPHFVKFDGVIENAFAFSPSGIVTLRFVIYDASKGGTALWQEAQNTQVDAQGRYEVLLGATASDGVPTSLFPSGEARWLGVQVVRPGSKEEPRVLLVSVPYALKAGDAQTLGGLPASAFAKVAPNTEAVIGTGVGVAAGSNEISPALRGTVEGSNSDVPSAQSPNSNFATRGSVNRVPKFSSSGLINSQITDSGGMVTLQNLSNILFADRFPNGVPDAVTACPANGCTIYALSPHTNLNLGTIDPGTKSITIYLGPYVYFVKQITLRKGMKIIGMGASGSPNGTPTCSVARPCNGTSLQSVNGNNPVFVIPQVDNMPATNIYLSGFRVVGSNGNTSEDGFFVDASSNVNSGLWNSTFEDIGVLGFAGVGIHLKARNNDFVSSNQWLLFNNVVVQRNPGGGAALRLEGSVFELRFRNCQFDGQTMGDGTNIYIGGYGGGHNGYPTSVVFEGLVSQRAATAVQIDGAVNIVFYASHHEALWTGYTISNNTNIGNQGITITDSYFAGNVGNNNGAGAALNITTSNAVGVLFAHNHVFGNPDTVVKATNLASVVYKDNLSTWPSIGLPPTSGMTAQMSATTSIDTKGLHSIGLNPAATPITTIQSGLGPGEMITLFTLGGSVTFGSGGNIDLMGATSINVNGSITFIRSDLGGLLWKPVSQWSPAPSAARASTPASQPVNGATPRAHVILRSAKDKGFSRSLATTDDDRP
jgi:hypothetical protein